MKIRYIVALVAGVAFAGSAYAADPEAGKGLTAQQQQQRTELIQKYDANSDGVLDKTEAKKMSKEDNNLLAKVGGIGGAKHSAKPDDKTKETKSKEKEIKSPKATTTGSDSVKAEKRKGKK